MAGIVIVGAGLTGLSAAWELERLGVAYTLIEVKPRLGGSLISEARGGFLLDGGGFIHEQYGDWPFLDELGLPDALEPVGIYRDGRLVIFRRGIQQLIDALTRRLTAPQMRRMAVSGVGHIGGQRYEVCLENGVTIEAPALILALPARYAEHALRTLSPEAALRLSDYRYDPVVRVHLGFHKGALAAARAIETGERYKFVESYTMPSRVPTDHVLVRVGVRLGVDPQVMTPDDALTAVRQHFHVPPVMTWTHSWPEADPLTRYLPEHRANIDAIDALLPPGVVLVGSDYRARRLNDQVEQGRAAARLVANLT